VLDERDDSPGLHGRAIAAREPCYHSGMKLVALVMLVACGGPAKQPEAPVANRGAAKPVEAEATPAKPASRVEETLAKYEMWTTRMCACPPGDTACAKQINDEQVAWADAQAKHAEPNQPMSAKESEEAAERFQPIMDRFAKCMMTALTPAGTP
jgi:hypothetical protein